MQDGEIVEDHLQIEDDSQNIVFDEGTPINIFISVPTGTEEGPKRFYLKLVNDAE